MTSRTIMCIAAAVLVTAWGSCCLAAEVYTWTDKHGVTHISDTPPDRPVKLKSVETFQRGQSRPDFPGPRYHRGKSRDMDKAIIDKMNERPAPAVTERRSEPIAAMSEREIQAQKDRDRQRKRQEIERLERDSLQYHQNQSDAKSNYWKKYWYDKKVDTEQLIEQKKREMD